MALALIGMAWHGNNVRQRQLKGVSFPAAAKYLYLLTHCLLKAKKWRREKEGWRSLKSEKAKK
jgi:hypothetical protein